jgi:hypothetical protein
VIVGGASPGRRGAGRRWSLFQAKPQHVNGSANALWDQQVVPRLSDRGPNDVLLAADPEANPVVEEAA